MRVSNNIVRILLFLITASSLLAATKTPQPYDGVWWQSTSEEQHRGWLAGYIDCSVINGKTALGFISWYTLEPEIAKYYKLHPSEIKSPVANVMLDVVARSRTPKTGEKTQVHSGFDGDYWRQSLPEHREGYIEGFLACHQALRGHQANFSKPPSWYVTKISQWFGVNTDDPGEINPKRENVAISKVLFKFKDATQKIYR